MGCAVAAAIANDPEFAITTGLNRGDSIDNAIGNCDVVIDFSAPDATAAVCNACAKHRKPLVLGTTGHTAMQKESVKSAARDVPIVFAANFSAGINVLFVLAREAAKSLGEKFNVEVIEMHHRMKKDAPSGTAKRLLEILREARGDDCEVPVHSIRAGDIVGDHMVLLAAKGERLELTHRAGSRETFALGALRAARWVVEQPPGLYDMEDVLGL
jgi:4-hydroxy-tetrahydrodipicolinate reductase